MPDYKRFTSRETAGEALAKKLAKYQGGEGVVVGLPRGGVVVAEPIARNLRMPMTVMGVKKIGAPWNEEMGIGAVAETGDRIFNQAAAEMIGLNSEEIDRLAEEKSRELQLQAGVLRQGKPLYLFGTTIIVDDGLATGMTALSAIAAARRYQVERLVVAVPVCSKLTCERVAKYVDEMVSLRSPYDFGSVAWYYRKFGQVGDAEVLEVMRRNN